MRRMKLIAFPFLMITNTVIFRTIMPIAIRLIHI